MTKFLPVATTAIFVCSSLFACATGEEVNQPRNAKAPLHVQNLHNTTLASEYLISRADAVAKHLNLDWTKLSRFYRTIVYGGDPVASGSNQRDIMMLLSQWADIKAGMASAFERDYGATFFDLSHGRWTTCASFSTTGSVRPVTFCGLNSKLDLPVPCRAPKPEIDYIDPGDDIQGLYEAPNKFNVGLYACSSQEAKDARATAHERQVSKNYTPSMFKRRKFDSAEVYIAGSSVCNDVRQSTCCQRACCNSGFHSSPFCQAQDSRRCY